MGKDIFNYMKLGWEKLTNRGTKVSNGMQPLGQPDEQVAKTVVDMENYRDELLKKIMLAVKKMVPKADVLTRRILTIYFQDDERFEWAEKINLANIARRYIDDNTGGELKEVKVVQGVAPQGERGFRWDDMQITLSETDTIEKPVQEDTVEEKPKKAVLSMKYANSDCRIIGEPVELEPDEDKVYNIGWSKLTKVASRPRKNQIAFEYKEPDKHDNNVFAVSRAHAHIHFEQGYWFLVVEERGTRQAGKRTKIVRDGKEKELATVGIGMVLRDNDEIRLNDEYILFRLV